MLTSLASSGGAGRAVLLLAPSARADLDDLQLLAARLYLDGVRESGAAEPEVAVCDPEGRLPADLRQRLDLRRAPTVVTVTGLPPVEAIICPPVMPLMTQSMLALEWVRREAVNEVITVDLSGVGFYLAFAVRQGLIGRDVTLSLIETGGAKGHDLVSLRYPDFPEIGLYHMEAEALRRAHRRLQPAVGAGRAAASACPTRLLFLIADSELVELDWIDRLLPRLTEAAGIEEVQFLRPGAPLTAAQKAKAAQAAGRIGAATRFLVSAGERPALTEPTLAVIVARGGSAGLLAHLAARWGLPLASAHPFPDDAEVADVPVVRLPKSPTLSAMAIDGALTTPISAPGAMWQVREQGPLAAPVIKASADRPLVTVCLVTFNRPSTLKQALTALEAQTFRDFEIVVIDDGSQNPEAVAYLDELEPVLAAKGWRIIRKRNAYPGAARNTGVAAARGDYVLFVDDDNIPKPMMIERFVTAALASGADILTCFCDSFVTVERNGPKTDGRRMFLGGALGLAPVFNVLGDVNALVRRETFLKVGGFTEDYGVGTEDWELWATAVTQGARLEVIPEALFHYRISELSVTVRSQFPRNLFCTMRPYLTEAGSPLGYYALRAIAETYGFGPFGTKR